MKIDKKTTVQDIINELGINEDTLQFQILIVRQVIENIDKLVGKNIKIVLKHDYVAQDSDYVIKRTKDLIILRMEE